MDQAQEVLVLFSPDDLVQLKDQFVDKSERNTEGKSQGQARPNVLFEAGLAMGRHQEKTLLIEIGSVKRFSTSEAATCFASTDPRVLGMISSGVWKC